MFPTLPLASARPASSLPHPFHNRNKRNTAPGAGGEDMSTRRGVIPRPRDRLSVLAYSPDGRSGRCDPRSAPPQTRPMPDPAEVAWQRVRTMAEKLVLARDELDDAGGLRRLASSWKPSGREKAKALLGEARKALEGA